jgi:DNA polymerase III subunit epsilon
VLAFLGDAVLVAHNARFDVSFLRAEVTAAQGGTFEPVVVDTAQLARRLVRDEVRNCRLSTLAQHFRSPVRPDHRALTDARATVDVLHGLIERAGTLGATTLEDLRDLARSTSERSFRRIGLVDGAPSAPGVYRFLDARGEVLYVGKATDLRSRLRTYFGQDPRRRIADLVRETAQVVWQPTATLLEAEVRELRAIHQHRPRYNRRSRNPEAAVHVAVTREAFPRLSVVRAPSRGHRRTVGPVASRRLADQLVAAIQDVFALRTCTPRLRLAQDHPACVLKELGRCGAPCDGTQSVDDYAALVEQVEAALDDPRILLRRLRERMFTYGEDGRFERASEVRGRLHTVARTLSSVRRRQALGDVEELVLRRSDGADTEIVVARRGRLAGTARRPGLLGDDDVMAVVGQLELETFAGPPERDDAEEVGLVLSWLDRPQIRLVEATGWAEPIAGGQTLADAVDEGRRVARQLRRDQQLLTGAKVVRRVAVGA